MYDNQTTGSSVGDQGSAFTLKASDKDLLDIVRKPVEESDAYWNSEENFKLKETRQKNLNLWLPNHWKDRDVYDYEEDNLYVDNRIFTSTETSVAITNSRIPQPEVSPAEDTLLSEKLGKDVQEGAFAWADKTMFLDVLRLSARNLKIKRQGMIKFRFDEDHGKLGEIIPESVLPEDLIIDKDAKLGDNPKFIAHKIRGKTVEDLIIMFPQKEQKILEWCGVNRKNKGGDLVAYKSQLSNKKDLYEIHFTYIDNKKPWEGVIWCDTEFQYVFDKMKTPNWNYDKDEKNLGNFFDYPLKPFMPMNYLNDGSSYIDLTSEIEQAASLQHNLNKRGYQIGITADMAGSGIVFNTNMITKEDMGKLIGHPAERIGVKGDVSRAMTRITPPQLPNYVIDDKHDARSEIDNIFATHAPSRGEQTNNKTLGQDVMQRQQDYTRQDEFARAVEKTATMCYRYLIQMMKVYYTEDHWFKITGEDGQFDHIVLKSDKIEDGIDIKVESGSMKPIDKESLHQSVLELAKAKLIDPLTLYETLGLPNPKKTLERFLKFSFDPQSFEQDVKDEDMDRNAMSDIEVLNRGEMPTPRPDITPEYLEFRKKYMITPEFQTLTDPIKQLHVESMKLSVEQAQKHMELLMSQMPTEDEMAQTNQKAVEQAQIEQQLMGAQPPLPGQPGAQGAPGATGADQPLNRPPTPPGAPAKVAPPLA